MSKISVMLVEDDRDIREALSEVLADDGYETVLAENGREALQRLEQVLPGLVLVDRFMPVMDGLSFIAALKRDPRFVSLPVVLMTATHEPPPGLGGSVPVLLKPVDLDELERVVAHHCGRPDPANLAEASV